jgi:hypothetical protein
VNRRYFPIIATLIGGLLLAGSAIAQSANTGKAECTVLENGETASGTVSFQKEGKEVAGGTCGKTLSVPAGTYTAVISLDGALDGPQQKKTVIIKAGAVERFTAEFATGTLEVRIQSKGSSKAGMAVIRKDGKQIGTLGSGVPAHLSAGTYQVEARYRIQKKQFDSVVIEAGRRKVLEASFE